MPQQEFSFLHKNKVDVHVLLDELIVSENFSAVQTLPGLVE